MYYQLSDRFLVTSSIEKTWDFFGRAENLPKITPPWLHFTNVAGPTRITDGSILDYTIRWMGVKVKWRTKIIDWSPPRQFIDLQIRGPYALWHHQHVFEPCDGGVMCSDRVIYRLPMPVIGRMTHGLVVKNQLLEIFRFRRKVISENLGLGPVAAGGEDARIERIDH